MNKINNATASKNEDLRFNLVKNLDELLQEMKSSFGPNSSKLIEIFD